MGLGFSAVRSYLPVEYFVEKPPELLAVADQLAQSCETQGIVRFRDPESEIASFRVFMCQVIDTAAILILAVQLRKFASPYCIVRRTMVGGSIQRSASATMRP